MDYQGSDRLDKFGSVGGDLVYKMNRNMQVKAQLRRDWLDSNEAGRQHHRHRGDARRPAAELSTDVGPQYKAIRSDFVRRVGNPPLLRRIIRSRVPMSSSLQSIRSTYPVLALAWLGRQGTRAIAALVFVGLAVPWLGEWLRPFVTEAIFVLLCISFMRVDMAVMRVNCGGPASSSRRRHGRRWRCRRWSAPMLA